MIRHHVKSGGVRADLGLNRSMAGIGGKGQSGPLQALVIQGPLRGALNFPLLMAIALMGALANHYAPVIMHFASL